MPMNLTQKLFLDHLDSGSIAPGAAIAIRIDQTLTPDSGGTLVMLELEALGIERAQTELSVQYVDHNLLQADEKNAEDHEFLRSAARRFGLWFSKPGNGVSHPVHMQRFGKPGKTLVGADSHTCAGGSLGMLAIGLGGIEVARAIAGEPISLRMPEVWGIRLLGELSAWVSAKDVILELLRRHGVRGAVNRVIEYHGPGLSNLTAMDRHVIANMGAELGATTTVFPSDEQVRCFLESEGRADDFVELLPDVGAPYDLSDEIDLATIIPLVALPGSPGNVVPVTEVAGREVSQVVVGSSANPGLRDFAIVAAMVKGRQSHPGVSFDVNPTSRQMLQDLTRMGATFDLIAAGARIHQAGCMGCIGMGQAPASGRISLRTMPRNFPGRSGTSKDLVYLCSPETAAAAVLTGQITDPRYLAAQLAIPYPNLHTPRSSSINTSMLEPPLSVEESAQIRLVKGSNIKSLPEFPPPLDRITARVLLKLGDNVTTDEISPGGARVLPFRSNLPELAEFTFGQLDEKYVMRAKSMRAEGHFLVAGHNYGQGSSREHAAMAPRYLGLQAVLAKSFARIHWHNLANFGVIPLQFDNELDYTSIDQEDFLQLDDPLSTIAVSDHVTVQNLTKSEEYRFRHDLSEEQITIIAAGGMLSWMRQQRTGELTGLTD